MDARGGHDGKRKPRDDTLNERKGTVNIVGVRFTSASLVKYFDPGEQDLDVDDHIVVEAEDGPREGVVAIAPRQVLFSELRGPLAPVLHKLASGGPAVGPDGKTPTRKLTDRSPL